jgi:hypothetical protein
VIQLCDVLGAIGASALNQNRLYCLTSEKFESSTGKSSVCLPMVARGSMTCCSGRDSTSPSGIWNIAVDGAWA